MRSGRGLNAEAIRVQRCVPGQWEHSSVDEAEVIRKSSSRVTVLLVNGRSADFAAVSGGSKEKQNEKGEMDPVTRCGHYYHLVGVARELLWFWDLGGQLSSNGEPWC